MTVTIRDLFCGAGGSSLGAELAGTSLRHALNHWDRAVETHATNFQNADHSCADIAALTTREIRRFDPCDVLWASPECTNHSLAKGGARRPAQAGSLFDDGPSGDAEQDRSRATMWDVVRFCEQATLKGHPYKAVIVENVVDVVKWGYGDDGGLFNAWLQAMLALGYRHELVFLNSMVCWPTPQSRDRVYVVFWLRGVRAPDLRFEPRAWCPSCERLVDGRQTWKRPAGHKDLGRVWGRYGPQYFYACPVCRGAALPAVYPAASIIDRRLEAGAIGDRARPLADKTRERIRRGLERLAREPFAIRLMQGGAPRPLTLPVVTLTQRHDLAMVMPIAGNTFERTSGNRARDARLVPLDTIHRTHERAMVVPPMGDVTPRDADRDPAPTQTTSTRAAIVHPRGTAELQRHGDVRPITDPVHTVRAGGQHHALVYANRANNEPRDSELEPSHCVLTGGTLGIVRNNTARGDQGQMTTPGYEPIRTLTTHGHQSVVVPYNRTGQPQPDFEPTSTLTTKDRLALVVPYATGNEPTFAGEEPVSTLTSRSKQALVYTDDDIDACLFRMFALHEIAGAMVMVDHVDGTPYQVLGNKRERMAQLGNAVTPPAARELVTRVLEVLS